MINSKFVLFLEFKNYQKSQAFISFIDGEVYPENLDNIGYILDPKFGDITKCLGEFFYLYLNQNKELEVRLDFCGFYSLFYKEYTYQNKKGILLSNCFHSIATYGHNSWDLSVVLPNILSKDQMFMQNYTNQTILKEIKRLGWDEGILINEKGFRLIKRQISVVVEESYEELLEKGIEKVQSILRNLSSKHTLNLSLSGGKDSRAILAILLRADLTPVCTTVSPQEYQGDAKKIIEKDFILANALVNSLNLTWFEMPQRFAKKITFQQSLERQTFFRSGYYLYNPAQYWVYSSQWGDDVQLRGGGGGLYKPTWGDYIKKSYFSEKIKGDVNTLEDDSRTVFKFLVPNTRLSNETYQFLIKNFQKSLFSTQEQSANIYEVLNMHYIAHRNRYHFGHLRDTAFEGNKVFYPLINEYFYKANLLLSESEKNSGKLIFDIIEHSYPELNNYEYDDGYHRLLPIQRRKKLAYNQSTVDSYYRIKDIENMMLKDIFKGYKNYNRQKESKEYIISCLKEMESYMHSEFKDFKYLREYLSSSPYDKRFTGKLVAILAGLPLEENLLFANTHRFILFPEY